MGKDEAAVEPITTTVSEDKGAVIEAADSKFTTQGLQRKLQARHVQMIAIGSNIGTGLFIGSGKALHTGGPASLVVAFVLISFVLTAMVQCLGEMSTVIPVSGAFTRYASRFYDRSLGFAIGWQYWLAWVAVFGAEASAFVILIHYWDKNASLTPLWISLFLIVNLAIHCCPVRVFGEVEFFVSALKVVSVTAFIIVTFCIMGGVGPTGHRHGTEYWHLNGLENGVANGFQGFASVFVTAGFAAGGVEMVGIVAGEAQHPKWNLPRAIRTLMYRIVLFYVLSMIALSFVVRYDDENLLGGSNAKSSPFVIAISNAGIHVLPDILNAILLICVCSVGSSSIYIASRTLHAMAEDGFAFQFFKKTDSMGRPYFALLFSSAIAAILAYLNCSDTGAVVFGWFSAISGMAFFISWAVIIACNWRFRAALKAQGDNSLQQRYAYRAPLWPWLSIIAFVLIIFMIICQLVVAIWPISGQASASVFFSNFISVPLFLVMWGGYKLVYWKTAKWQRLEDVDIMSGRREEDLEEEAKFEAYHAMSMPKRALSYLRF